MGLEQNSAQFFILLPSAFLCVRRCSFDFGVRCLCPEDGHSVPPLDTAFSPRKLQELEYCQSLTIAPPREKGPFDAEIGAFTT